MVDTRHRCRRPPFVRRIVVTVAVAVAAARCRRHSGGNLGHTPSILLPLHSQTALFSSKALGGAPKVSHVRRRCRPMARNIQVRRCRWGRAGRAQEKLPAEDEANKLRIEAKNGLQNYWFTMRNTLNEIESAVQETLDWLDKNQLAEKDEFEAKQKELEGIDEFEAKQKELEGIVNPIMMKVYQAAGGGGMPEGGMPGGAASDPTR
eukprot:s911_g7.t2